MQETKLPLLIGIGARIRKSPYFDSTIKYGVTGFTIYNKMYLINLYASGPETSTCLSAAKSPKVTSFTKLSYSFSVPAKLVGKYILL